MDTRSSKWALGPVARALAVLALGSAVESSAQIAEPREQWAPEAPGSGGAGDGVVHLDRFEVIGEAAESSTLPVRPLSSIYGLPQPVLETPRAITQVSPHELKYDPVISTADFIRYAPSVNFNAEKNNARAPSIRGALGDIYQNGFWLAPGVHPLQQNAYESVDIVAGPAGVIFGPTQRTSSYVNYITKAPDFSKRVTEVSLSFGRWVAGGGSYDHFVQQIDTTAPITPGKLAYRLSIVNAGPDTYYKGIKNEHIHAYAALGWRPSSRVSVDWNAQFGVFDYQDVRGWNRVTQDLVDNGNYITGTAVPIVRGGPTGFYTPVVDAAGNPTGYVTRIRQADGKYVVGTDYTPPAVATSANTVAGWLLDPTGVRKIKPYWGENSPEEDFNDTKEFITQLRIRFELGPDAALVNGTNYQHYTSRVSGTGFFIYGYTGDYFENRTELQVSKDRELFGAKVRHSSNTGFSLRYNEVFNVSGSPGAFWSSAIDLLGPARHSNNGLFGTTVIDPAVGTSDRGAPVDTKFGSIWFPVAYPTKYAGVYTSPGVANSAVGDSRTIQPGLFTQQNFDFENGWGLNLGGRITNVHAKITNPFPNPAVPRTVTDGDKDDYWLPAGTASLTFKPFKGNTTYFTYGYSEAINTSASQGLLWDTSSGTSQPVLGKKNFQSVSEIYELGSKSEIIPGKLVATANIFKQTRVQGIQNVDGVGEDSAQLEVQGAEVTVRYEPNRKVSAGLNYAYVDAKYLNYNISVQTPYGFVADNATPFALSPAGGIIPRGDYRLSALPRNSGSVFASYRFDNGFGIKALAWYQDSTLYKIATDVRIPDQYNLDVAVSYRTSRWYVQVDFLNITDEQNFANVGVDGVDFLQPLQRFGIQGRFTYRF